VSTRTSRDTKTKLRQQIFIGLEPKPLCNANYRDFVFYWREIVLRVSLSLKWTESRTGLHRDRDFGLEMVGQTHNESREFLCCKLHKRVIIALG
jgi:hypothetical protein